MATPENPTSETLGPPDLLAYADPGSFLRDVLRFKQAKNPRFSLRSFAKALALPPSSLNAILTGERKLSPSHSVSIGEKIGLTPLERTYFQLFAVLEWSRGTVAEASLREKIEETAWLVRASRRESANALDFVPEWYHLAITVWAESSESTKRAELEAFGESLGLTGVAARDAIDVLVAKGILEDRDGALVGTGNRIFLVSEAPNAAFRRTHEALLQRAANALVDQPPSARYSATEFVSFDAEGFRKLRELADQFLDRVHYESKRAGRPRRIYGVALHAFPLPTKDPS